jgi:release factor glutamine methyltransferase
MTAEAAKDDVWTIERVLRWAADDFRSRGIESPRLDAEVLLAHALGTTRIQLIMDAKRPLMKDELGRFRDSVKRRRMHEPVAYVLGEREFYGHTFRVDRRALIPRPDTETLVQVGIDRTTHVSMAMVAADLCTGTGCVAISLALARPTGRVYATDLSPEAAALARENAVRLGARGVTVTVGDLFAPLSTASDPFAEEPGARLLFDLVTANPPYIPASDISGLTSDIRDFEPRLALDGGDDGLAILKRVVAEAPAHLRPGGVLAVEVGAGEADAVRALFQECRFREIEVARDYARIERVVSGVHQPE